MKNIQGDKDKGIFLLNKLNNLQKKILEALNARLKINLTGEEIKIDLNNKNIYNIDLSLLTCLEFKNLEEINLSHNKISDIEVLKEFNSPKLKKIDLSFNKLSNINKNKINTEKKEIDKSKNNEKINSIESYRFPFIENIILDNNNLIQKDIKEIKDSIVKFNFGKNNKIKTSSFFLTNQNQINQNNDEENENTVQNMLLNKLDNLEKKVLNFLNVNLNINLTGKEIKIDLNSKNISNIELSLLSCIDFNNLEEINLSHNNISDIKELKDFNTQNLKRIDLSYNKIIDIKPLNQLAKKDNKIEIINLSNNSIENAQILTKNIFPNIQEINLDNNNVLQKDIEEIKNIIFNHKKKNQNLNFKSMNFLHPFQIRVLSRLKREFSLCQKDNDLLQIGCSFGLEDNNLYNWKATMIGPFNTPYEKGIFTLSISFPENYPEKGPVFSFKTKIYALFVDINGRICLSRLNEWSNSGRVKGFPSYNVKSALFDIFCCLCSNKGCRYCIHDLEMQKLYLDNPEKFYEVARNWTKKFAEI